MSEPCAGRLILTLKTSIKRMPSSLTPWSKIEHRAAKRKGGKAVLQSLLPDPLSAKELRAVPDDRIVSAMARCIFNSGFHWQVITQKWPGFEAAFKGFEVGALLTMMPDEWEALTNDTRIVRNGTKIMAVAHNAGFVADVSGEHGSFGTFLADWPATDQVGLLAHFKKRGSRLGGNTGQYFLRRVGYDGFILSRDVVFALQLAGLDIKDTPTSKRDLAAVQDAFNRYRDASGYSQSAISRILSYSVGDNMAPEALLGFIAPSST